MSYTNLPTLESTTKCTLKFNDIVYIPMHEEMTAKLFVLMADQEKQNKIREWLTITEIKLIYYNEVRHIFKPSNEVLLDAFWYIVNKVVTAKEEYKLTLYKNLILNVQRIKADNLEEIKSFINIIEHYSHSHIKVLKLVDGIMDYIISIRIPTTNTIPATLAHCIEYVIVELSQQHEACIQIWKDLLELGLRKEYRLHRWMTEKMFVKMSLTSDSGKTFLRFISKCG